jgi:DNA polymerase elongation subunit (family B)
VNNKFKVIFFDLEILVDIERAADVWFGISDWPGRSMKADINSVICFGWKELGKKVQIKNAWDFPGWGKNVNDDKELCKFAYDILKDADIIVTQNGKGFDQKFLQTRLLINSLTDEKKTVLPKIEHIDTKQVAKSNLFLTSNSLKRMAQVFTKGRKMDSGGQELWNAVRRRDQKAMEKMAKYCKTDVTVLEDIYLALRPLTKGLDHNLLNQEHVCSNCGSYELKSEGFRSTLTRTYRRLCCKKCGTWMKVDAKQKVTRL